MANAIKKAKKLPVVDEVFVPGERGDKTRKKILSSGEIKVENNLLCELEKFVKS